MSRGILEGGVFRGGGRDRVSEVFVIWSLG